MDILDDIGVSKLSAKVFNGCYNKEKICLLRSPNYHYRLTLCNQSTLLNQSTVTVTHNTQRVKQVSFKRNKSLHVTATFMFFIPTGAALVSHHHLFLDVTEPRISHVAIARKWFVRLWQSNILPILNNGHQP